MTENPFITYQPGMRRALAKSTLSKCIVSLTRRVYECSPNLKLGDLRIHDTRRLASSWALSLFNVASLQEIIQTAHWASETTFLFLSERFRVQRTTLPDRQLTELRKRRGNKQWVSNCFIYL